MINPLKIERSVMVSTKTHVVLCFVYVIVRFKKTWKIESSR